MNGTTKAFIIVFGFVGILLAFTYFNRETYTAREMNVDPRAKAENRTVWYKINDGFDPPILTFLNGCWQSETSEDVFFTNAINGDFYFKDGLKQEVWFNDFDTMEAYYNGNKTWGGDLHRNKEGDKIRVNKVVYYKVNCYSAGMTD